jgi:glycosyltransferase involved in cell wall biosynthesis
MGRSRASEPDTRGMISILTPAFNESANLDAVYERLAPAMAAQGTDWEWIIVDDHSRDDTFAVIERLTLRDPRVRGIRLARNSGSHLAIMCALHHAAGDAAVLLAADLQDPPEFLAQMIERWRAGAQVVWAVRRQRPGDTSHQGFAAIYYWVMRELVGMKEMPATGADFFLIDRVVIHAFRRSRERNTSVFALITWLGFRQEQVEYDKQPRVAGRSGWTLARKITLVIDSVTSFSDFPLRWCLYGGLALIGVGLIVGIIGLVLLPSLGAGLLLLMALILVLSGLQLGALAIVGQYVYRALDEARGRPRYVIEAVAGRLESPQAAVE